MGKLNSWGGGSQNLQERSLSKKMDAHEDFSSLLQALRVMRREVRSPVCMNKRWRSRAHQAPTVKQAVWGPWPPQACCCRRPPAQPERAVVLLQLHHLEGAQAHGQVEPRKGGAEV